MSPFYTLLTVKKMLLQAPTTNSDQSQKESNTTIKITVFLIICYVVWTVYKRLKYRHAKYRKRQYFKAYIKQSTILKRRYKCTICKKKLAYGIMITSTETGRIITLEIVKHYVLIAMQRKHVVYWNNERNHMLIAIYASMLCRAHYHHCIFFMSGTTHHDNFISACCSFLKSCF